MWNEWAIIRKGRNNIKFYKTDLHKKKKQKKTNKIEIVFKESTLKERNKEI